MEVSLLDIKACLLIWMLTCLGLVSSQELHLSSFPTRPLLGQNVTLICNASFTITFDPIVWFVDEVHKLSTQTDGGVTLNRDKLTGKLYVSTNNHQHNLTYTVSYGNTLGPWTCRSNVKGVSSNELTVTLTLDTISTTTASTFVQTVPDTQSSSSSTSKQYLHQSTTSLVTKRTAEVTSELTTSTSGHTEDVTSGQTIDVTSGQTINVTSGHNVKKSNEAIYIAVGSSVGVAILIAVIAITVCCILKRKRGNEDDERVMEENVLYMSSSLDDTEGPFPIDGQLYATINKPKQAGNEGVNLDELYAKPNKPKKTYINGVNPDELYAKPIKPIQTGSDAVNVDDLYAKPNKTGKKEP